MNKQLRWEYSFGYIEQKKGMGRTLLSFDCIGLRDFAVLLTKEFIKVFESVDTDTRNEPNGSQVEPNPRRQGQWT
tara:strand:- start:54 stop:278 length:225 start_codon:yes stop_codon:yes gene_type:complete